MQHDSGEAILTMEGIVKYYGHLLANDQVNLSLHRGEILAVVGENGAGKTTLMKILYGMEQPASGTISLNNEQVKIKDTSHAISLGIGMVQQHFMLFDPFTVAENIVYGKEPQKGLFFDLEAANNLVAELSKKYDLPLNPTDKIQGMPIGLRQRVEILKVLYQNANIIIFDEPTAVLTPQEVTELIKTIKQLAAAGKSIIIITHKLNEVMALADRVMVMRGGKQIADLAVKDTTIEDLSFMMVGRRLVENSIPKVKAKNTILEIKDLSLKGKDGSQKLTNINLHIEGGEIVGIAGVSGNGQSELVNCLFGLQQADSGTILVNGVDVFTMNVQGVRTAGVSMIPEDRYLYGSASQATIAETAIMGHYRKAEFSQNGFLKTNPIKQFVVNLIQAFDVKTEATNQKTAALSGGNAQKLIAARELSQDTALLLACEPTRGVDIGAMEFIHNQLLEKRIKGDAVLLVSSELSEILKLSDRIYVMYEGKINGEFTRKKATEKKLGLLMAGGKANG